MTPHGQAYNNDRTTHSHKVEYKKKYENRILSMPRSSPISPSFLVARYLRSNNYAQSLDAFIREANLPKDAGSMNGEESDSWSLEQTLEEKCSFDKSLKFERAGDGGDEGALNWTSPGE